MGRSEARSLDVEVVLTLESDVQFFVNQRIVRACINNLPDLLAFVFAFAIEHTVFPVRLSIEPLLPPSQRCRKYFTRTRL